MAHIMSQKRKVNRMNKRYVDVDDVLTLFGFNDEDRYAREIFIQYVLGDRIYELSSAEQQRQWILLTEGLPEIGDRVLVTIPSIGETFVTIGTYAGEYRWYISDYGFCEKVIAWLPLPKPYKEGE